MGSSICKGICPSRGSGLVEVNRDSMSESEDFINELLDCPTTSTAPINVTPISQPDRNVMTKEPKSLPYFRHFAREETFNLFTVNETRQAPPNKTVADCKEPLAPRKKDSNNVPGPSTSRK